MLNKNKITDIFFDLDHTLWDFEKNSALTFEKIFHQKNLEIPLTQFLDVYNPINHRYWKLYRDNKITQEQLRLSRLADTFFELNIPNTSFDISAISEQYMDDLSSFTHLFSGTHRLLKYLKNNYSLHIITNGFELVQHHKIKNSGLDPYFECVFTAEKVGFKKPHPQIFKEALNTTNTKAETALMIGDSLEADVLGALDNGMQAIHFNSLNESAHDHCTVVHSLDEIFTIFSTDHKTL